MITDLIIIALSAFLLWNFSHMWRYGAYLVGEPNIVIRSVETVVLVLIFGFGVGKYIIDVRRGARGKSDKD